MTLLVVHALSVAVLTGLSLVVQLVVYPSFRIVGPTPAWQEFHAAHSRGLVRAVGLPWAVQGGTLAVLLLDRPDDVPLGLVLLASALGAASVLLTVLVAVPLHSGLGAYDDALALRLIAVHRWRTLVWVAGTVVGAVMVVGAA